MSTVIAVDEEKRISIIQKSRSIGAGWYIYFLTMLGKKKPIVYDVCNWSLGTNRTLATHFARQPRSTYV